MKAPTVESVEKLKPIKIQSYNYIKYPTPSSLQAISSGFDTEKDDGSAPLVTDLDLYHLGLQIKHLPIYKLLQTANKTVLTDDWKVCNPFFEYLT